MQSAVVVQICDAYTYESDRIVSYAIKYDSLLKGSATGTSIKIISIRL